MLCKECIDCFWHNSKETHKSVSSCDDNSQVCIPVPKAHVIAIAKDIAYRRYEKTKNGTVAVPTALDFAQALALVYGKKRKHVSMKCIENALQHQT